MNNTWPISETKGANELFLFSVITGKYEMAKIFWTHATVIYNIEIDFFTSINK
jgi:hypothetical protein